MIIAWIFFILEIIVGGLFIILLIAGLYAKWEEYKESNNPQKEIEDENVEEINSSPMLNSFEEDFDFCVLGSNLFVDKQTYSDGIIRELDEKSSEVGAAHLEFWKELEARLNNYLEINPTDAEKLVLLDKVVKAKDDFYGFYIVREGKKYELARMSTNFLKTHYSKDAEDYEEVVSSNSSVFLYIEDFSDDILLSITLGEYPEEVKNHYKEQYARVHMKYREICANLISKEFKNQIYSESGPLNYSEEFENLNFVLFSMKYFELQGEVVDLIAEEKALDFKSFSKLFKTTIKALNLERNLFMDNP